VTHSQTLLTHDTAGRSLTPHDDNDASPNDLHRHRRQPPPGVHVVGTSTRCCRVFDTEAVLVPKRRGHHGMLCGGRRGVQHVRGVRRRRAHVPVRLVRHGRPQPGHVHANHQSLGRGWLTLFSAVTMPIDDMYGDCLVRLVSRIASADCFSLFSGLICPYDPCN
jgi:hypothetical protein